MKLVGLFCSFVDRIPASLVSSLFLKYLFCDLSISVRVLYLWVNKQEII